MNSFAHEGSQVYDFNGQSLNLRSYFQASNLDISLLDINASNCSEILDKLLVSDSHITPFNYTL